MGAGTSGIHMASVFETMSSWSWDHALTVHKAYCENDYEFSIDSNTVSSWTGLGSDDSLALVNALKKHDNKIVNSVNLIITTFSLCDSPNPRLESRLTYIFQALDFSRTSVISTEEFEILLHCVAYSLATVLKRKVSCPNDAAIAKIVAGTYEDLDKRFSKQITQTEFVAWGVELIHGLPEVSVDCIYDSIFLKNARIPEDSKLKDILLAQKEVTEKKKPSTENEPPEPTSADEDAVATPVATPTDEPQGVLEILSLKMTGLRLSELEASQNPFVEFKIGDGKSWQFSTEAKSGGLALASWSALDFAGSVPQADLHNSPLIVQAKVEGGDSNSLIGTASIECSFLLGKRNQIVALHGVLVDDNGNEGCGECDMKVRYREESFNDDGYLDILGVDLIDIEGTDDGPLNLYAELLVGDGSQWKHTTGLLENVTTKASWPSHTTGPVKQKQVLQGSILLRLKRRYEAGDSLVGVTVVSDGIEIFSNENDWTKLRGSLVNSEGSFTGQYEITAKFRFPSNPPSFPDSLHETETAEGTGDADEEISLEVSRAELTGLKDTGSIFSKQSPYLELKVGDGSTWQQKTSVKQGAGVNATWDDLNISAPVQHKMIKARSLIVRAESKSGDKLIGEATINADEVLSGSNDWVNVEGTLVDKDNKPAGKYVLKMRYNKSPTM